MSSLNRGFNVARAVEAFAEFGQMTAAQFADYADISRYDAHAVLNRMNRPTKAGVKRIHIIAWDDQHDNARRYPRAVFKWGDGIDKKRPKPDVRAVRRRSEEKRNKAYRMNSVFNMGITRETIREIRRNSK